MKNYLVQCLFGFFIFNLSVPAVFSFEEEHEAHEHGHASLMIVQEKDELQLVFKSPAMNIVGFEHQPSSQAQYAQVDLAKTSLSDAKRLFQLSANARCELEHTHISSSLIEEDKHGDEHGHDEAAHEDHEGEDSHSEFEAEYHFECANIKALKEIKVALFQTFSSLAEVEAQVIANSGQRLFELDHDNVSIKF